MHKPIEKIPPSLVSAIRNQRAVLFLGAGASLEARDKNRKKPPTGDGLRDLICDTFFEGHYKDYDLASASEFAFEQHGNLVVNEFIKKVFDPFLPSKPHLSIPGFKWAAIVTTNYDTLVEKAYAAKAEPLQTLVTFVSNHDPVDIRMRAVENAVEYIKLHGCIDRAHDVNLPLILSLDSYDRHLHNRQRLFTRLGEKVYENTFVFCGYRLADSHIRKLVGKIVPEGVTRPTYFMVCPNVSEVEKAHWRNKKIEVLDMYFGDFMEAIEQEIPDFGRGIVHSANNSDMPIRDHFRAKAIESDKLSNFLTTDVEYVHSEMAYESQNPKAFYAGFDNGWGCIINDLTVPRGIVDDVLLKIIETEDDKENVQLLVLKGPAGNGKTIALKQTGWELATGLKKIVVHLKEGGLISPSELAELHDLTGRRIFVLIDKISLFVPEIKAAISFLSTRKVPVTFVATESDADWNNYCDSLNSTNYDEFRVRYLSKREIEALVDKLGVHNCLGDLSSMERSEQVRRFEESAERQLLVALHEATQGKRFEDIVLDEFKRLPDDAGALYLDICTMHQFGVGARAGTISRLSGISFPEYSENFFKPLENIVLVRRDSKSGDQAYFARHATVASLVFRGICRDDEQRFTQLHRMISSLDTGFSSDRSVFERLIRAHMLIRRFDKAEHIRALFEAITKVSEEAFIYQQWAMFESTHKDGSFDIAKEKIELARNLDRGNQTIIHTEAEVFRKNANVARTEREALAYRRIVRERIGDLRNQKSRFAMATRAKLVTDELEDLLRGTEDSEAIMGKADDLELVLSQASKQFSEDAEFQECEARFQLLMKDDRRAVAAMEKAVALGTRKSGTTIRLANAYKSKGNIPKAIETIQKTLESSPDLKRHHFVLAKLFLEADPQDLSKSAHHFSRSYDAVDEDYESRFWHAMLLFLLGRFELSFGLFDTIDNAAHQSFRRFPTKEKNLVENLLSRFQARVVSKTESFLFLEHSSFQRNIYSNEHNSEPLIWDRIGVGSTVSFDIRFSRRGPIGYELRLD